MYYVYFNTIKKEREKEKRIHRQEKSLACFFLQYFEGMDPLLFGIEYCDLIFLPFCLLLLLLLLLRRFSRVRLCETP